MPDLFFVLAKRWKFILGFSFLVTITAFAISFFFIPKEYLSTATALPANSVLADKGRIFNNNVENLYSDFGTADELDRILGTAALDTVFITVSKEWNLPGHYLLQNTNDPVYNAAMKLKGNSRFIKSDYGELKIKVWDEYADMAAKLANALLQELQKIHQSLQNESNSVILKKLNEEYTARQKEFAKLYDSQNEKANDSISAAANTELLKAKATALNDQLLEYQKLINQYTLAVSTNPQVLLIVENARPSLYPDKPDTMATVLFTAFASFIFFFLLALFMESRKTAK